MLNFTVRILFTKSPSTLSLSPGFLLCDVAIDSVRTSIATTGEKQKWPMNCTVECSSKRLLLRQ